MLIDTFATLPGKQHDPEGVSDTDGDTHQGPDHDDDDSVVRYTVDNPVSVDGATGVSTLYVLTTPFDDHIVTTAGALNGAGLNLSFANLNRETEPSEPEENGEAVGNNEGNEGDEANEPAADQASDGPTDFEGGGPFIVRASDMGEGNQGVNGNNGNGNGNGGDPVAPGPVVSRDIVGLSAVINHTAVEVDLHGKPGKPEPVDGIALDVATPTVGQIVIRRQNYPMAVSEATGNIVSYTVSLVTAPRFDVFVNVSASIPQLAAFAAGARQVEVSTDGGVTWGLYRVIKFAAGQQGPQTVMVRAAADEALGADGAQTGTIGMSSQSLDPAYNHVAIQNVLVQVIDNDHAGLLIVTQQDGLTVLAGTPPQGIVDSYTVALATPPVAPVTVTLVFNEDRLALSSTDPRWNPATNAFTFAAGDTTPATVTVAAAVPDGEAGDGEGNEALDNGQEAGPELDEAGPLAIIAHLVTSTDPAYAALAAQPAPTVPVRILPSDAAEGAGNMQGLDEGDGGEAEVYVKPTAYSLLVVTGDPAGATYSIRLTESPEPGESVVLTLNTDGQTLVADACSCDARFTPGTSTTPPTITFTSTNWYLPFTVRVTANPAAPATDPFQPLMYFPVRNGMDTVGEDHAKVHFKGDGNDAEDQNDGGFDDAAEQDHQFEGNLQTIQQLVCPNGTPDLDSNEAGGEPAEDSECQELPGRPPIMLPALEQSQLALALKPTETPISPNLLAEASSGSGAAVTYPSLSVDEINAAAVTYSQPSGTIFSQGSQGVTATATAAGGQQVDASFNVVVSDTTPPTIMSVSPTLVVEATMPGGAVVNYAAATATDAVTINPLITYSQNSGTVFPLGTTFVTVTATDAAGNASSASFTILVQDTTAPAITSVSPNLVIEATTAGGATVTYAPAIATDAVTPSPTITYSQASGTVFPLGTTTVNVTATDAAGNVSSTSFTVLVRDTTPPAIAPLPNLVVAPTSSAGAVVTFAASATDAVTSNPVITYSQNPGTVFPLGLTTVTVRATDAAGNSATATFTIDVPPVPPVLVVPAYINLANQAAVPLQVNGQPGVLATISLTDGTTTVSVSGTVGASGTVTLPVKASTLKDGTITASGYLTDAAGNRSAAGPALTSIKDTAAPTGTISIRGTVINTQLATNNRALSIQMSFSDVGTGLGQMAFSTNGGTSYGTAVAYATTGSVTISGADGLYTVAARVSDRAGNSVVVSQVIRLDTTGPVSTYSMTAANSSGWYDMEQAITISYSASDLDNVASVTATLDGTTTLASGSTIAKETLSGGAHTITITATDGLGNKSTTTITFQVHETINDVIMSIGDGLVRSQITAAEAKVLSGPLGLAQAAISAGNRSAAQGYLATFVADVKSASGTSINSAYAVLLISWANDLSGRI